ncbi:U2 snRNP complex subunit BUD31 KNAG_0I02900 [Huiozyma naganishii CBS 8797]|uniref:Bud site selection protein 31 n=1 Tax=Huiozyma naganishii (strain ATCC MYA-139 / BCRC 22969 / CBS 8797 / KCTC 17520 / NBRC 10181 / NCYC 3082 / Yp74L-3) TaxID=1071383 RepID=J7S9F3_HUIN7|nr:hypothetical protein KNAG_0I02900 [Kazachstania naganishii CBS 8797]CCK72074.1 hypothetical protein KNAG_0I02900 [Kazachstania naganishii CBS 8797]
MVLPHHKDVSKAAPDGYEKLAPTFKVFAQRLSDVHNEKESKLSTKANEKLWKIMQIHHERSLYVFKLYYKRKLISRDLYEWLLKRKLADRNLIAKWRKKGYEKLCCLRCIQSDESQHGTTCICRVPRAQLEEDALRKGTQVSFKQCVHCGCHGCASSN